MARMATRGHVEQVKRHTHAAYDYDAQRWLGGVEAARVRYAQLVEDADLLSSADGGAFLTWERTDGQDVDPDIEADRVAALRSIVAEAAALEACGCLS